MWIATLFVQQKLFSSRFCLLHLKIKKIESGFISELLCPLRKRPLSKNCFEEARGKFVFPYEKLCSVKRISLCVCKTSFQKNNWLWEEEAICQEHMSTENIEYKTERKSEMVQITFQGKMSQDISTMRLRLRSHAHGFAP